MNKETAFRRVLMIITYISHSGFSVELPSATFLFDYYKGELPCFRPDKPLYVFASHQHSDHFNPDIFQLTRHYPDIRFILSRDIWTSRRKFFKAGVADSDFANSLFIRPNETISFPLQNSGQTILPDKCQILNVRTLRSTDLGIAFLIECDGQRIYHAGDLNWWLWKGDSKQEAGNMTANFKRELDTLSGIELTAAFVPLDPRQEEYYSCGINYFLDTAVPRHVFPMHFWDDYRIIHRYLREFPQRRRAAEIHEITHENQSWKIDEH